MRRALVVLAFLLAWSGAAQVPGGPLPGPLPLFPGDNWWNLDVTGAPKDSGNDAFLAYIGNSTPVHPDWGGDLPGEFPATYGMVYITVPGTQPLEPVAFDYVDESDAGAPGRPAGYPIPVQAKTQPQSVGQSHWIEGGYPGNCDRTYPTPDTSPCAGDNHMLIVDVDHRLLFETWNTRCLPANDANCTWSAGSGAVFALDSNARRPEGWTSADAAGLAILPGLVRYDEAYGTGPIKHAFRFTVRRTNGYVWPASHVAGSTAGALPMGARLRLKPGVTVTSADTGVQRIVQAMKTYGLIVADNGSNMYVQGTYDPRWDMDVMNSALGQLHTSDFEVVKLGWNPTVPSLASIAAPVVVGSTLALDGTNFSAGSVIKMFVSTSTGPFDTNTSGWTPTTWSQNQLTWDIPASVTQGQGFATLQVINTDQAYTASNMVSQLVRGNAAANLPTVLTVKGTGIDPADPSVPGAHIRTVVTPGSSVTVGGTGFVVPLVNLFTASGNAGPITPTTSTSTSLTLTIPNNSMTQSGPGVFQVVNSGAGYTVSNAADAVLGAQIAVSSVNVVGSTVTVNGAGFCPTTVLNLFAQTASGVQNLGGLNGSGNPNVPITFVNPAQITFTRPGAALAGNAFVQALNPPFTPYTASSGAGGAFSFP